MSKDLTKIGEAISDCLTKYPPSAVLSQLGVVCNNLGETEMEREATDPEWRKRNEFYSQIGALCTHLAQSIISLEEAGFRDNIHYPYRKEA